MPIQYRKHFAQLQLAVYSNELIFLLSVMESGTVSSGPSTPPHSRDETGRRAYRAPGPSQLDFKALARMSRARFAATICALITLAFLVFLTGFITTMGDYKMILGKLIDHLFINSVNKTL